MPTWSIPSSSSPTPSAVSQAPSQRPDIASLLSARTSKEDGAAGYWNVAAFGNHSVYGETIYEDSDDENNVKSTVAGAESDEDVGLFDVVKREFRLNSADIQGKGVETSYTKRKPKINFIQDMKNKVGRALEYRNRGLEEMQNKDLKKATKLFHFALLQIKGLDPDEGVNWSIDFDNLEKNKLPLRVMPSELKEIKEGVEIDCYIGLANCLQRKEVVPYRRIKEYCMRILEFRDDNTQALTKCGMACYYLREYELSRFYLQTAKDLSREPIDAQIKKYLRMVETQLSKVRKKK